jgi:XPC-binding domain
MSLARLLLDKIGTRLDSDFFDSSEPIETTTEKFSVSAWCFLQQNVDFQRIRQLIHQKPQLLEPLLHHISAANSRIVQLINQNLREFLDPPIREGYEPNEGQQAWRVAERLRGRFSLPGVQWKTTPSSP